MNSKILALMSMYALASAPVYSPSAPVSAGGYAPHKKTPRNKQQRKARSRAKTARASRKRNRH